ncbi:MAG TPA: UDP-glucose/GDP-mannose dehydrogenase family protein [Dinghuibacter sp.]|uniref:UDP-glucose dehydrogenase family protein n=1 Tax=Dinghuibacter sp. TaxID=2024697 RepID=UPI002BBFC874|nr:UDP-glucose/GDP-mannose dehydrogenase family protein [Dinghuibacter sp.]HTJ12495.1 UDP-glucose/GDP-mannose dehydrogenase family protein [Dinghuibacter sp.]
MKIAVVGTGYVGLVTGTCFAETGNNVTCIDIDAAKVKKLSGGEITIYEPGLEHLFLRNLREGRLHFTTDLAAGIKEAQVIFLALPTPPGKDGAADLSYVLQVADNLGDLLTDYKVIVDKSTVPVGTADKVHAAIARKYKGDFDVASNPEFLREGVAVDDFMKPDRVVIGTTSERARKIFRDLYAPFVRQGNPVLFMDERSAELSKYAANAFLATKITFMNEIARLCELFGADVDMVRRAIGSDERIGKRFLFPGIGYGGSCFPKDVQALHRSASEAGYQFRILDSVMHVNEAQKVYIVPKIQRYFKGRLEGRKIAIWGLAFKPNTDDIREAPALYIIDALLREGVEVHVFDPEAMGHVKKLLGDRITYGEDQYEILEEADAIVICTEWSVFRTPDFEKMAAALAQKVIFDGRNVFEVSQMQDLGYYYESVGRHPAAIMD